MAVDPSAAESRFHRSEEPSAADELDVVTLSEVKPERIYWLWPNRFALGKINLFVGFPGVSKSLLLARLIANVTRGGQWPDGTDSVQGHAIILSAEDGIADTLRPRIEAVNGRLDHVHVIRAALTDDGKRAVSLLHDCERIDALITRISNIRLLCVDPMNAYLGTIKEMDSYRDTDVRSALLPLVQLTERRSLCTVGVTHFNKNSRDPDPLSRIVGSQAFGAAARMVHVIGVDPTDANPDRNQRRRVMACCKSNISLKPSSVSYTVRAVPTGVGDQPTVIWGEVVHITAEDLMKRADSSKPDRARTKAEDFLIGALKDGPRRRDELVQLAEDEGVTVPTLKRAKTDLLIEACKQRGVPYGEWWWRRPGQSLPWESNGAGQGDHA